ncbi:hypothetical protein CAP36_06910 [Chitinophagaceae bacterium IBVUCB2]|nr:hypothetical protein CAP36_06910 [Chitinophagaceae bacterium IBVUCB2]
MKKIAAILLLIFALVQAGPAIISLFSDATIVFIVDEEKGSEKIDEDKKDKKENPYVLFQSLELSHQVSTALNLAESLQASPFVKKPTPPPNFC